MVYGEYEIASLIVEHEEYDLFISGQSKPWIEFCIHPVSEHRKTWFTKSSEDPESHELKILHVIQEPITENFVQIETDVFMSAFTFDCTIFSDFLSRVPVPSNGRELLANEIISDARKLIATLTGNKSVAISIAIEVHTEIYLDQNDMKVVKEYEKLHGSMIPASMSSIAALQRVKREGVNGGNSDTSDDEEDACAVCLQEYMPGSTMIRLECWHKFHADCITNWLQRSHRCPLCRFQMPSRLFEELFDVIMDIYY